ncbi:hypothetical protein JHK86_024961 [Glycine max]|nr:hypothetical protein JHK86_024961 [Glycine max]
MAQIYSPDPVLCKAVHSQYFGSLTTERAVVVRVKDSLVVWYCVDRFFWQMLLLNKMEIFDFMYEYGCFYERAKKGYLFKSNKRSKKVPNSNSRPLQPTRVWREESASFIVSITNQILKVIKKDERVWS